MKDTSGHAFPLPGTGNIQLDPEPGMTLRDYFAAHALSAIPPHLRELQTDHRIKIAEWAYGLADAMLEARKQ